MQKTSWTTKSDIKRDWYIIDVKGKVLGRAATKIASLLIGKSKVNQVPNLDNGDYVVVINAKDIELTRGKETKKMYYAHTTHPGGFSETRFDKLVQKDPTAPLVMAVTKMLPKTKLRDTMLKRLFVYSTDEHKHEAQQPKTINL